MYFFDTNYTRIGSDSGYYLVINNNKEEKEEHKKLPRFLTLLLNLFKDLLLRCHSQFLFKREIFLLRF